MEVEAPSPDTVCIICQDTHRIPCRTSCHHWYCAGAFSPCECPFCRAPITPLHPQPSPSARLGELVHENLRNREVRIVDVLRDVEVYNSFQAGGLLYLLPRMRLSVSRICRDTINPRFPCAHIHIFRFIALLIGFIFEACHIDMPRGLKLWADIFDVWELFVFVFLFILYVVG